MFNGNTAPLLSLLTLVAAIMVPGQGSAESSKVWQVKPDKGFIDDAMTFDDAEEKFAYIHTDSAQLLNLIVLSTQSLAKTAEIAIKDPTRIPKGLTFADGGQKLIFIWQDNKRGILFADLIDIAKGKTVKQVGPADDIQVTIHNELKILALVNRKVGRDGSQAVKVTAYRPQDFKLVGQGHQQIKGDGTLTRPNLRLLYWDPGHVSLMGMMKGAYDKKRDVRLPDKGVRFNILTQKTAWSQEPQDLVPWTKATNMRVNQPGQFRFLQVSDDLKTLYLASEINELSTVSTPVQWSLYEPKSLKQQESWDGKILNFSLTIDPVNPAAVKRKKADQERMDLYRVDPGLKSTLLGQVLTQKRDFSWRAGARFFAYLEKLKGFSRGGKEIRLYRVSP